MVSKCSHCGGSVCLLRYRTAISSATKLGSVAARSNAVAKLLDTATSARVTCPLGTDLTLDLSGRPGIADDGDLTSPGAFGNLPCGEAFISPLGGDGQIIATSLAPLGLSKEPATLTVERGKIVEANNGLGPEYLSRLVAHGDAGRHLAELGHPLDQLGANA